VNRLCTQQRLWSVHAKKRGPTPNPGPPVHDDLVERSFTAVRLDQLWLTDITEHPSAEGKLYLCAIKDARSRRIVGSSMSERMTAQLAVDALNNAVLSRRPEATAVHSDCSSQFRSNAFVQTLRHHRLTGSWQRPAADHLLRSDRGQSGPLKGQDRGCLNVAARHHPTRTAIRAVLTQPRAVATGGFDEPL
jgi:putative transposase